MSTKDLIGLVLSYGYAFGLLLLIEALRSRLGWPQTFTRKLTHIGAGLWIWGLLLFFEHWTIGIIPFATFIVLNYLFLRQQTFKAIDTVESTPGTVYFAFSITLLLVLFWRTQGPVDRVPLAVAALMAMTLGDGSAALVGLRWGRRSYRVGGHQRTWEGSAAMAAFSFLGILLTLLFLPGSTLSPYSVPLSMGQAFAAALVGAGVATVAEGLSPAGSDNLSVPLLTALALYLLSLAW